VLPLTVRGYSTTPAELREYRDALVDTVERMVLASGAEAESEVRLDSSRAAGVLHCAVEQDATCVVVGWKGWSTLRESFFGEAVDSLLAASPVPVLVVRAASGDDTPARVVVAFDDSDDRLDHLADHVQLAPTGRLIELLRTATVAGDIIVKALPSTRAGLGNRFVRQTRGLDDRTIVAASPGRTNLLPGT